MSDAVEVRLPVKWFALIAVPLLGLGALQWRSADAQADSSETFQRALLEHSQDPHKDAASKLSMQRVDYIVQAQGQDIEDLKILFGKMVERQDAMVTSHNELLLELRTRVPGGVR